MVKAIVGGNWGDEGKGKITDLLAKDASYVVRFQGGSNAGHTIVNDYGKFALHMLPSGVFHKHCTCCIGNGVVLNVNQLIKELKQLEDAGVPLPNLKISYKAHLVMSYHILFDTYEEERRGKNSFGSTKSGIAPCYSDKYSKIGFQVGELYMEESMIRDRVKNICDLKNPLLKHLYHKDILNEDDIMNELIFYREQLRPFVDSVEQILNRAISEGKNILLEGQLGALKDTDHGIYPMVTSSSTLAGYGCVGAGISPKAIDEIITVVKAYSSAVGAGPFVSELFGDEAEELRRRGGDGGEYGATTGRPRRVGFFDALASRYGCLMQGATQVALTVLDPLGYLDTIPVCTAYEVDGKLYKEFPPSHLLNRAKPVYTKLKGWKTDITHATDISQLPQECIDYIDFIEKEIGVPITMVSNGPKRSQLILRKPKI